MMLRKGVRRKRDEFIICGSTLVRGSKLPENHQNQVGSPKLNGLRIEMTNLQGFIVWGLKK